MRTISWSRLTAFLIILWAASLSFADWVVSGYIYDSAGNPLSQVLVRTAENFSLSAGDGSYRITVTTGDTLLYHKMGYEDQKVLAAVIPAKLILQQKAIKLEGRSIFGEKGRQEQNIQKIRVSDNTVTTAMTTAEFISAQTNLIMSDNRQQGAQKTVKLPGYDSRHTVVMLDGIPLNDPGEEFDLSLIPLEIIDEIEIMPGSAFAGSGNMGTVINLVTQPVSPELKINSQLKYGSFGFVQSNLNYSQTWRNLFWQINVNYQKAENDFKYKLPDIMAGEDGIWATRENNEYHQFDLLVSTAYQSLLGRWQAKYYYTDLMRMLPGQINNSDFFYKARLNADIHKLQIGWQKMLSCCNLKIDYWLHQEETVYDNTRLLYPYNQNIFYYKYSLNKSQNQGIKPVFAYTSIDQFKITAGAQYTRQQYQYEETTNPGNSLDELTRDERSLFVETRYQYQLKTMTPWIKLSGRMDDTREFGREGSGSVFAGLKYEDKFCWELTAGRLKGYSLPSFYSLYWQGDAEASGNPELIPEKSSVWICQNHYKFEKCKIGVDFRYDDIDDKIIWIQTYDDSWKPINISAALVTTLRFEAELSVSRSLSFSGSYALTASWDKTKLENGEPSSFYDKELIYTPDYQGNLGVRWDLGDFTFQAGCDFTGSQWTTRDQLSSAKQLAGYELYHCSLGYHFSGNKWQADLALQINNLFNSHYYVYEYMPQPGRNITINLNIGRKA